MTIINSTNARKNFYKLIENTIDSSEPVFITGKKGNVVMISESDFKSMEETIYLMSIPRMEEKIIEGINTNIEDCIIDENDI